MLGQVIRSFVMSISANAWPGPFPPEADRPSAHIALTRDSTGAVRQWCNGVPQEEVAQLTAILGTVNPNTPVEGKIINPGIFIGVSGHYGLERWAGDIAEVLVSTSYISRECKCRCTPAANVANLTRTTPKDL